MGSYRLHHLSFKTGIRQNRSVRKELKEFHLGLVRNSIMCFLLKLVNTGDTTFVTPPQLFECPYRQSVKYIRAMYDHVPSQENGVFVDISRWPRSGVITVTFTCLHTLLEAHRMHAEHAERWYNKPTHYGFPVDHTVIHVTPTTPLTIKFYTRTRVEYAPKPDESDAYLVQRCTCGTHRDDDAIQHKRKRQRSLPKEAEEKAAQHPTHEGRFLDSTQGLEKTRQRTREKSLSLIPAAPAGPKAPTTPRTSPTTPSTMAISSPQQQPVAPAPLNPFRPRRQPPGSDGHMDDIREGFCLSKDCQKTLLEELKTDSETEDTVQAAEYTVLVTWCPTGTWLCRDCTYISPFHAEHEEQFATRKMSKPASQHYHTVENWNPSASENKCDFGKCESKNENRTKENKKKQPTCDTTGYTRVHRDGRRYCPTHYNSVRAQSASQGDNTVKLFNQWLLFKITGTLRQTVLNSE